MGLIEGVPPPVDPVEFMTTPYLDRLKVLTRHWVDYGSGLPKFVMVIYIVKMAVFAVGGVALATLTSHLNPLHPSAWFDVPLVWQKLVCWVMLVEALGIGGAWGPLCGHFKPMTGGVLYWARPGTIRLPPWAKRVPLTSGDNRTVFDVALYLAFLAMLALTIALPGIHSSSLLRAVGVSHKHGLVSPATVIPAIVLLIILGLRDKTVFLAARGEQWLPALIFFAFFPFTDMIVAAKMLIVCVWFGAGVSKMNPHFEMVIPPMVSNTPWLPFKWIKRKHYAGFPDDLLPSRETKILSHVGGAVGELIPPWVLLFSHNTTVTLIAAVFMMGYHVFITSTFPLAVPLEWNLMFIYLTAFLFLGFPAAHGYGLGNMGPALLAVTAVALVITPALGERRPDLISFLPSLRQYAGNWATSMWAFAPGTESKLDRLVKPAPLHEDQLGAMFDPDTAKVMLQQYLGWRSMHSQGRGLNSLMIRHLGEDIDRYDLREGELECNLVIGWNFGDGHLHNPKLIEAIQRRCNFAPGELIVVYAESEPILGGRQAYQVIDAALGVIERGSWAVTDALREQPWLPNGPIPTRTDWALEGYQRVSHGAAGA